MQKVHYKILLLGGVNSGKTCLVIRYIWGFFTEEVPSVSTDPHSMHIFRTSFPQFKNEVKMYIIVKYFPSN